MRMQQRAKRTCSCQVHILPQHGVGWAQGLHGDQRQSCMRAKLCSHINITAAELHAGSTPR
jgi:hypothetical protein